MANVLHRSRASNGMPSHPRLPPSATEKEVLDAESARRREAKLGMSRPTPHDFAFLGPVPRSESDIQDAVTRLQDPKTRVVERLFWPIKPELASVTSAQELETLLAQSAGSDDPIVIHDRSLLYLSANPEVRTGDSHVIGGAVRDWAGCMTPDDCWDAMRAADEAGGFAIPAKPDDITDIRRHWTRYELQPVIAQIRTLISLERDQEAAVVLAAVREGLSPEDYETFEEEVLGDLEARLVELCEEVRMECGSKITRKDDVVLTNRPPVITAEARYTNDISPLLDRILRLQRHGLHSSSALPSHVGETGMATRCRFVVANCLLEITKDATWAELPLRVIRLAKYVLAVAPDTPSGQRLQEMAQEILGRAPSEETPTQGYTFLPTGEYTQPPASCWGAIGNILGGLLIAFVLISIRSCDTTATPSSSSYSGSAPPNSGSYATTQPETPVDTTEPGDSGLSSPVSSSAPAQIGVPSGIESIDRVMLQDLSNRIDAKKAELAILDGHISDKAMALKVWEDRLEGWQAEMKRISRNKDNISNANILRYKALLEQFEQGTKSHESIRIAHNRLVVRYNKKSAEEDILIERHNAILRRLKAQ